MKKKLMLLTLSLTMLLVIGQAAYAAGSGNGDRPNGSSSQNWVPLAQQLNLNDRQVQQLKEINL
ncbi:MAG: pilus assembly protein, partial [Syntrophomonas sp.]